MDAIDRKILAELQEDGRLTVSVRLLANASDRRYLTSLVHRVLLTFLAAAAGIMAVLMIGLRGGPALVHADAYRLGSPAEVDDLDLDADTATSVTVVEWGGGLVEGLAQDWLDVSLTPLPGGDGEDEPRAVRLAGQGGRWSEAAGDVQQALAGA